MKINIDISLFCSDSGSIGRIHGSVNLPCAPFVGSSISFSFPAAQASFPVVGGFSGLVRVSSIQFVANNETDGVLVLLEDVVVPTRGDGMKLAKYLLDGFGLYLDEND
jgi:hypothetical protein